MRPHRPRPASLRCRSRPAPLHPSKFPAFGQREISNHRQCRGHEEGPLKGGRWLSVIGSRQTIPLPVTVCLFLLVNVSWITASSDVIGLKQLPCDTITK